MDILSAIETGEERICRALLDDQPRSGRKWNDGLREAAARGMLDVTLKDHLVMHSARLDTYDQLRGELVDVTRSRQALGTPMQVGALVRPKCLQSAVGARGAMQRERRRSSVAAVITNE